jgi:hypothetical protein
MIERQPVPGIMRDGSTPAASSSARSSIDSEFTSLFVPNTASPQFCDSNHLQCAMNRRLSGARSALNGVTTGQHAADSLALNHGFSFIGHLLRLILG